MLLNAFQNQSILPVSPYLFLLIFQAIKTFRGLTHCVTDICKSRASATFFLALDTKGLSTAWLVCA